MCISRDWMIERDTLDLHFSFFFLLLDDSHQYTAGTNLISYWIELYQEKNRQTIVHIYKGQFYSVTASFLTHPRKTTGHTSASDNSETYWDKRLKDPLMAGSFNLCSILVLLLGMTTIPNRWFSLCHFSFSNFDCTIVFQ